MTKKKTTNTGKRKQKGGIFFLGPLLAGLAGAKAGSGKRRQKGGFSLPFRPGYGIMDMYAKLPFNNRMPSLMSYVKQ